MSVKFCSLATINFTPATGGKEKNIILGVALQLIIAYMIWLTQQYNFNLFPDIRLG